MKNTLKTLFLIPLLVLLVSCNDNDKLSNSEKAIEVLHAIQTGDIKAMQDYINPNEYIQHNLSYPNGASAVIGATQSGAFEGTTIETVRSFEDNDIVVLHSLYAGTWNNNTPQVVFDVFRFKDGLIVEHWDNLDNQQNDNDGTTQLNGTLTPATDIFATELNREVVTKASQKIFLTRLI